MKRRIVVVYRTWLLLLVGLLCLPTAAFNAWSQDISQWEDTLLQRWPSATFAEQQQILSQLNVFGGAKTISVLSEIFSTRDRPKFFQLVRNLRDRASGRERGALLRSIETIIEGSVKGHDNPWFGFEQWGSVLGGRDGLLVFLEDDFYRWADRDEKQAADWFIEQGQQVGRWAFSCRVTSARQRTPLPFDAWFAVLEDVCQRHPDAECRAWALTAWTTARNSLPSRQQCHHLLAKEADASVRSTWIRLSGLSGSAETGLDLVALMKSCDDPALLEDVVRAYSLSLTWIRELGVFEYFPGRYVPWLRIQRPLGRPPRAVVSEQARDRLRNLLEEFDHPGLRDACSLVLASTHSPEDRLEGFRVAEWGVWVDGRNSMFPPQRVLDELPGFVHRSRVAAAEIKARRFFHPTVVTKPVVFFDVPRPLEVDLEVGFRGGRPWTYYPRATDYRPEVVGFERRSREESKEEARSPLSPHSLPVPPSTLAARAARPFGGIPASAEFKDHVGISPPWLQPVANLPGMTLDRLERSCIPEKGSEFANYFRLAPWLEPRSDWIPTQICPGPQGLGSLGLEWRGLRLGYPAEFEAELEPAPADHWWNHLRDVGATRVSARGESESFLFYDGSIRPRGPVQVGWGDAEHESLLLRPRPMDYYELEGLTTWRSSRRSFHQLPRPSHDLSIPAVFVISNGADEFGGLRLESLPMTSAPLRVHKVDLTLSREQVIAQLKDSLQTHGLSEAQARSLVLTWSEDFFGTPGIRVITLLPQWLYEFFVPLRIKPHPEKLVRAGLIWTESEAFEQEPSWHADLPVHAPRPWPIRHNKVAVDSGVVSPEPIAVEQILGPREGPGDYVIASFADDQTLMVARQQRTMLGLYRVDLESSRGERLYLDPGHDVAFAGDRCVYVSESRIVVLNMRSGVTLEVPVEGSIRECALSQDGNRIAWVGRFADVLVLQAADLEEGTQWTLLESQAHRIGSPQIVKVALSSTGRHVVASVGTNDRDLLHFDLEQMTVANLTCWPDRLSWFSFDRDQVIVLDGFRGRAEPIRYDISTGELRPLLPGITVSNPWMLRCSGGFERVALFGQDRWSVLDLRRGREWIAPGPVIALSPTGAQLLVSPPRGSQRPYRVIAVEALALKED